MSDVAARTPHTASISIDTDAQMQRHDTGTGAVPASTNPRAAMLRQAGLCVTSARLATLHAVPIVLDQHGCLTPKLLHDACRKLGYFVSVSSFYQLLPALARAGLVPANAIQLPPTRMAGL